MPIRQAKVYCWFCDQRRKDRALGWLSMGGVLVGCALINVAEQRNARWRERARGGQSPPPPAPPGSRQENRRCAVPSAYPFRLRVGRDAASLQVAPSARIHAGCPGLQGTPQRFSADSPHFTISKKHHSQLPVSANKINATQSQYKKRGNDARG